MSRDEDMIDVVPSSGLPHGRQMAIGGALMESYPGEFPERLS